MTEKDNIDVLLVKDDSNTWFFCINDDETSYSHKKLLEYLKEISKKYERVICIGSSMGGFAAIFFGTRIHAHKIIAFSPQINLQSSFSNKINDYRNILEKEKINSLEWTKELLDLSKLVMKTPKSIIVFFGKNDPFDMQIANLVKNNIFYDVIELNHVNHGLVHVLKKCGVLDKILNSFIESDVIFDPSNDIAVFRKNIDYTFIINFPIQYIKSKNILKFNIDIITKNYNFWMQSGNYNILINLYNETESKTVLWYFETIEKKEIKGNYINYKMELDISNIENGFYSCDICMAFDKLKLLDLGFYSYYFQFEVFKNYVTPISILKTGENATKMYAIENFFSLDSLSKRNPLENKSFSNDNGWC